MFPVHFVASPWRAFTISFFLIMQSNLCGHHFNTQDPCTIIHSSVYRFRRTNFIWPLSIFWNSDNCKLWTSSLHHFLILVCRQYIYVNGSSLLFSFLFSLGIWSAYMITTNRLTLFCWNLMKYLIWQIQKLQAKSKAVIFPFNLLAVSDAYWCAYMNFQEDDNAGEAALTCFIGSKWICRPKNEAVSCSE